MGHDSPNCWQTSVECVLVRGGEGEGQRAYLSHECRKESVSPEIFSATNYEFVVIDTWNGIYNLRSGSFNYGFNPLANFRRRRPDCVYEKTAAIDVFVQCADREARFLEFDEALAFFRARDSGKNNKVYLELAFDNGGHAYRLYAPCRYTNFPHAEKGRGSYLQPITGYTLFEEGERFYVAYTAAHVTPEGTQSIEFCVRDMTSFIATKNTRSRAFSLFRILDRLALSVFLVTDDFTRVCRVDGTCRIFDYR